MRQSLSPSRMPFPGETHHHRTSSTFPAGQALENHGHGGSGSERGHLGGDAEKYEIKAGKLLLQHRLGKRSMWLPVYVRVYRGAFEHFAVVSKDQTLSANSTYVNLRTSSSGTSVLPGDVITQFRVVQNNHEGTVITFDTTDKSAVSDWVDAFTPCCGYGSASSTPPGSPTQCGMSPSLSPAIPRSPVMPTLPELDEEE